MQSYLQISNGRETRHIVPKDFEITDWESLKPYLDHLLQQKPNSLKDLEAFLKSWNEIDSLIAEDFAWRYIRMTCHTKEKAYAEAYQVFVKDIMPQLSVYEDKLNRKIANNPFFAQLPEQPYKTYKRRLMRDIELFREENAKLDAESKSISQKYGSLTGAMSIQHEGEELTLQQAAKFMEDQNRALRQEIWEKMNARRLQDQEALEDIFDQLVKLRHQMALNADYADFTAFKFDKMGRFDYSIEDTQKFHDAVEKVVRPVYEQLMEERRQRLGVNSLRPWDTLIDIFGAQPLQPFENAPELLEKSMAALKQLKPELGQMLSMMDEKGFLDLESRVGKAPGGYNYPLMESGVPFIFMNAAGSQNDVITLLHESGHAVHAFLTQPIPLNVLKRTPSEVAELAAMAMELLCLDGYDEFYDQPAELIRAKKGQLLRCINIFPWIATVDAFQQWVYKNPHHSREARNQQWVKLYHRFHGNVVDWTGYEAYISSLWLKQGHIFDVPFYYIEYAIAQLGAFAVWRNFKKQPQKGLNQYLEALKLGYTRTIPEIYETAGIRFDFSAEYVQESITFCLENYMALKTDDIMA